MPRKRFSPLQETIFLVALVAMAAWELLWATESPSPWGDAAEKYLRLGIVFLTLAAAIALFFFLYFAASFGCKIGGVFGGECTFASAAFANWLFFPK
ncbi:MAG: hypothetical protein WA082_01005 [Candidatus Moraniibacteriota bacterium]